MARHVERPISLADFAPPGGNRDHAQSDEPDLDCGRDLRRAVFPVLAPLDANHRGAPVSGAFDPRRLRRRTGAAQIPAIAMGRRSRFLGRQCRSHRHIRLHGHWLEPGRGLPLAAARLAPAAVLGTLGSAGFVYWRLMRVEGRRRHAVHLGVRCARAAADAAPRLRLAPRFHLSRDPACAFWPIELVSGHGRDRRADLFFPGAFRSAAAGLLGWRRVKGRARRKSMSARMLSRWLGS